MKCPYNGFKECIVEKCPSCNYKETTRVEVHGRYPAWMSEAKALELGNAWECKKTEYEFVSCKLVDNAVQPAPTVNVVHEHTTTHQVAVVKQGLINF